jgi:hypothetical protein
MSLGRGLCPGVMAGPDLPIRLATAWTALMTGPG